MATTYVTLRPVFRGPTAGYQAVEIASYDDPDFCVEPITDVLRRGPWSDALLIARSRGIEWAASIGVRWRED